jgi:hypothetical protein
LLGFREIFDQSSEGLEKDILQSLNEKGLSLKKCRGQGYDGAAVMSGVYSGVQARILSIEKTAAYVHCAAHNLNLVLSDAVSGIVQVRNFFDTVQKIYTFFGSSIIRWSLLENTSKDKCPLLSEPLPSSSTGVTLKKLCPTRWSSRLNAVIAVKSRYTDITRALTSIILNSNKSDEKAEATGLRKEMQSFEFVIVLVMWYEILKTVDLVSKLLQTKNMDLHKAANLLRVATEKLKKYRNSFHEVHEDAKKLAEKWGVTPAFSEKRARAKKRFLMKLPSMK